MTEFTITPQERSTNPLWVRLMRHLEEKRAELRSKNDGPLDPIQTAEIRGQIREISRLLALNEDKPIVQAPFHEQF